MASLGCLVETVVWCLHAGRLPPLVRFQELPGIPYGEQDVDGHVLVNDLERPVFEKHLFLAEVKRWLMGRPGVRGAMMSGSGSTMFAVVEDEGTGRALMEDAARELDPTLWMWSGLVMQDDAR